MTVFNEVNEKLKLKHVDQELFERIFDDLNSMKINLIQFQALDNLESLEETIHELHSYKSEMDPKVYEHRLSEALENKERTYEISQITNYLEQSDHIVEMSPEDFFNSLMNN